MDNKNLILAIVLSTVLLWGYSAIFLTPPKNQITTTSQTQNSETTKNGALPHIDLNLSTATTSSPEQPARDIIVDTPLMNIIFSERGGTIRKVILKKYYMEPGQQGGPFTLLDIKSTKTPYSLEFCLPKIDPQLGFRTFTANTSFLKVESEQNTNMLKFKTEIAGLIIEKHYIFHPNSYAFTLVIRLTNHNLQNLDIAPEISLYEDSLKADLNTYAFTGLSTRCNYRLAEYSVNDLTSEPQVENGIVHWLAMNIPYFMGIIVPLKEYEESSVKRSVHGIIKNGIMVGTLIEPSLNLAPNETQELSFLIFYGPRDLNILESLGHNLTTAVDFGWFDFIAKLMLVTMNFFNRYSNNYGIAIIIITILIKLLLWPVAAKSYKSIKKMHELQPILIKIKEKYKNDHARVQQETVQLYKTYKVNPLGGCLPMLIQFPVFIAFYKVLGSAIELRHAPFLLWINDLSAPDRLSIGFNFIIPFAQQGYGLPVLTILMGVNMFIQQKMTPSSGDPIQSKMMLMMPLIFTFMFLNFPSGLVLYWLVQGILSIFQQYWSNK